MSFPSTPLQFPQDAISTDTPGQIATPRSKRSEVIACLRCKERKVRCDEARPQCERCARRGDVCEYPLAQRRRGPGRKSLAAGEIGPTSSPSGGSRRADDAEERTLEGEDDSTIIPPSLSASARDVPRCAQVRGRTSLSSSAAQPVARPESESATPDTPSSDTSTGSSELDVSSQLPAIGRLSDVPAPIQWLVGHNTRDIFWVNGARYENLGTLGEGGSSSVHRVLGDTGELRALKRVVKFEGDVNLLEQYKSEITHLKSLSDHRHIIRLFDSEVKEVNGRPEISLLMECGEADLSDLLRTQRHQPFDVHWVLCWFKQILECVKVVHARRIVHGDLKPSNFVLVKGHLKLIDFGIAHRISADTTNVHLEDSRGTRGYMSPETLLTGQLKIGRSSDVWSIGCILYYMVYGNTPFEGWHLPEITSSFRDRWCRINFPEETPSRLTQRDRNPAAAFGAAACKAWLAGREIRPVPRGIIAMMRKCLVYTPADRAKVGDLLGDALFTPNCDPKGDLDAGLLSHFGRLVLQNKQIFASEDTMKEAIGTALRGSGLSLVQSSDN